ncbi:MAG: phosphoribosylglycinamide formyltransferase [Alphaproteobacteria bacterium]|nr:phosphoribosylglycinamide formyltransferase [Alphaproteobacteria bacterium]
MGKLKVVVLISGRGSNLKAIINKCSKKNVLAKVIGIISNNSNASGLKLTGDFKKIIIDNKLSKKRFETELQNNLEKLKPDLICLAGFMKILSPFITKKWKNKIINVHPSLLPSFKGLNTHERALKAGVKKSGCTIHFVDESLDGGPIIAQVETSINKKMSSKELSEKILKMEHKIYPEVVSLFAKKRICVKEDKVIIKDEKKLNFFIKNI